MARHLFVLCLAVLCVCIALGGSGGRSKKTDRAVCGAVGWVVFAAEMLRRRSELVRRTAK